MIKSSSQKQQSGFFKSSKKRYPMFPFYEEKVKYDDYGEIIKYVRLFFQTDFLKGDTIDFIIFRLEDFKINEIGHDLNDKCIIDDEEMISKL